MSVLKMAVSFTVRSAGAGGFSAVRAAGVPFTFNRHVSRKMPTSYLALVSIQARFLSSHTITKNIQYITEEKGLNLERDPNTLKLVKPMDKPLCILLSWLMAKKKHIHKYARLYLEQGYDVLSVTCTPWQMMWPIKGSQPVAADLLRFMDSNTLFNPMVIHGFSVGAYMWGEVCLLASADKPRYQPVLDRVAAQIWDSAADISELQIGVPKAVFPENQMMQNAFRKYTLYHMKAFYEIATIHYMRSSQQFHLNLCRAPALFLLSKSDPVGAEASNRRVHDSWKSLGIKTTWKCWDKSAHTAHYLEHTSEYLTLMSEHLGGLDLLSQPEKIRARI